MPKVIALCGMTGSGKSTVSAYFKQKGFTHFHLGVTEEAIKRYGKTSENIEKELRIEVRKKYGMEAMAVLWIDTIKNELVKGNNVIIDNMYSWSEYKYFLKELKESFISIAIHASPKTRYKRLGSREDGRNYKDSEVSKARDYSEIEDIEKGGPIAMADFHVINERSEEELISQVEEIFSTLT